MPSPEENDRTWEDRAERGYDQFTQKPKRTIAKWFFIALAVIIALSILFGAIKWIGSWGSEAARVTGPENTKAQFDALIQGYEDMEVAAENACQAKDAPTTQDNPTFLEDPNLAYDTLYREAAAEYDARLNNWFQAGGVLLDLPDKYPDQAPSLTGMQNLLGLQGC